MENQKVKKNWKEILLHEFKEYMINFVYMAIFFSAVVIYRRLVLAQYDIFLDDYFVGVIKALIIAKVVMIGTFLRISRKFEDKPLIIPVMFKAVLFTLWVMLFDIFEEFIRGLIHTHEFALALEETGAHLNEVWLGASLLIFVSFVPFFALKELSRTLGNGKLGDLFFGTKK